MKVFVTGASGFVGGAAVRHLVAQGHEVTAMSRRAPTDDKIRAAGATPVRCDLENVTAEHLGGAEAVLHCAAFVEPWGEKDAWHRINVGGTARMLEAAAAAGVRRFIHIGTEAAIVHGQHIDGADETYPLAPGSPYPYCATKAQAERLVREARSAQLFTIILRPRFIWGPGDTTLLPVLVEMAKTGQWRFIDGGRVRTSTTHIDNLVHAIELALTEGKSGEAYFILDDGEVTMRDMLTAMAGSQGIALPDRSVPSWVADGAAWVLEGIWRTFGVRRAPPLTRHAAMVMARDCVLVGDKAKADLGYTPVISREQGLAALADA